MVALKTQRAPAPIDLEARNARVLAHQALVRKVAIGFRDRGLPLEDLVQAGNLGLMRAAEKFDPERGTPFVLFASYWIRRAIHLGIGDASAGVSIPRQARAAGRAVLDRADAIEAATGRTPDLSGVVRGMPVPGRSPHLKRERLIAAAHAVSGRPAPVPVDDLGMPAPPSSPLDELIAAEERERYHHALGSLPDDQRDVISLRFGLDGSPPLTIAAIVAITGLSRNHARWHEAEAMATLRRQLSRAGAVDD